MTSALLLAGGVLTLALASVHSVLGEWLFLRRVGSLPWLPTLPGCESFWKDTLRMTWHVPSVLALALGAILIELAFRPGLSGGDRFVVRAVALSHWLCAALALAVTRGKHPAWPAFAIGGVLCWLAAG